MYGSDWMGRVENDGELAIYKWRRILSGGCGEGDVAIGQNVCACEI
jgi:hypothetical protein